MYTLLSNNNNKDLLPKNILNILFRWHLELDFFFFLLDIKIATDELLASEIDDIVSLHIPYITINLYI